MAKNELFIHLQSVIVPLLVYADSQVHYNIAPSLNIHCPRNPCLTLADFAANFTEETDRLSLYCQEITVLMESSLCLMQAISP